MQSSDGAVRTNRFLSLMNNKKKLSSTSRYPMLDDISTFVQ